MRRPNILILYADQHRWDALGCNGNPAQQFRLTAAGDLVNPQSGRCVDVSKWGTTNGSRLLQWDCHGGSNQKWRR